MARRGSFRQARWGLKSTVPPSRSIQPGRPDAHRPDPVAGAKLLDQFHDDPLHGPGVVPGVDRRASLRILPSASTTPAATLVPPMSMPIAKPLRPKPQVLAEAFSLP